MAKRPTVSLNTERRLRRVARDVGEISKGENVSHEEAITAVLEYVESQEESDKDTVEVDAEVWAQLVENQEQQSEPFGNSTTVVRRRGEERLF